MLVFKITGTLPDGDMQDWMPCLMCKVAVHLVADCGMTMSLSGLWRFAVSLTEMFKA